jgi:hypothetical protein
LRLPPAARAPFPTTPPHALPRRSISEMANEQLRRDRPSKLEDGIDNAKNSDCLNVSAGKEGDNKINESTSPAGLMNIGPLLKRTLEGKCAK